MAVSPPASPTGAPPRPISAVMRTPRSTSRLSMSSRQGGSRASDEDGKTAVKVGMCILWILPLIAPFQGYPVPAIKRTQHQPATKFMTDFAQLSVCDHR